MKQILNCLERTNQLFHTLATQHHEFDLIFRANILVPIKYKARKWICSFDIRLCITITMACACIYVLQKA